MGVEIEKRVKERFLLLTDEKESDVGENFAHFYSSTRLLSSSRRLE